ncbi:DUF1559 domain-containing protein [Tautonia rosea]|uniref:DUF1559 domain-containing protein n=1 Tax=Tautonia rosea TaxID=2728037 RepID=UPI0014734200|nr:DUF1559 domain-containing protein [Tautonia rosea]
MRTLVHPSRWRRGFTLIELLVVIAIIGVLVALIMPAVQSAREAANRTQCKNNLKQIGLAAQGYHDAFGSFPSGWFCNEANDPNCVPRGASPYMWNGLIGLFPFLEARNLYDDINFDVSPYAFDNRTAIRNSLSVFVCPSHRQALPIDVTQIDPDGQTATLQIGPSDYRGNMAAGMTDCNDVTNPDCFHYDNGVTFRNSRINISGISDGTSQTLLIGESLIGTWPDATNCCVRTTADRRFNAPNSISGRRIPYWESQHPGMVNFCKADGSVSSLRETVRPDVLIALMTRAGGETLSAEDYE